MKSCLSHEHEKAIVSGVDHEIMDDVSLHDGFLTAKIALSPTWHESDICCDLIELLGFVLKTQLIVY